MASAAARLASAITLNQIAPQNMVAMLVHRRDRVQDATAGRLPGSGSDHWLSTNTATDTISFTGFSGVIGISGFFFGSDVFGAYATGRVAIRAYESPTSYTEVTLFEPTPDLFLGFVSTNGIIELTVTAVQPDTGFLWPTVNELTFAAAVPEPSSYMLMFAGLGVMGFIARRRKV